VTWKKGFINSNFRSKQRYLCNRLSCICVNTLALVSWIHSSCCARGTQVVEAA